MDIEKLKKAIKAASNDKVIDTVSKGILKLTDQQIDTVSFVFWLCYMAETDLNSAISKAWNMAQKLTSFPNQEGVNKLVKKMGFDFENLEYFGQKINLYDKMFGKTPRTKLLWKINTIRNDLTHNRLDELSYDAESLMKRETKEKLMIDYFETSLNSDLSKSRIWKEFSADQKK